MVWRNGNENRKKHEIENDSTDKPTKGTLIPPHPLLFIHIFSVVCFIRFAAASIEIEMAGKKYVGDIVS